MRKIYATGFESYLCEDAPTIYVSGGSGNLGPSVDEVHITFTDPEDGYEVRGWFRVSDLLAAIKNPGAHA